MPALDRLQAGRGDSRFEVVAVNVDTARLEKRGAFLDGIGVKTLTRYADPSGDAFETLRKRIGPRIAERYLVWRRYQEPDRPVILLLGGATGAGKTSLGLEVAHRLGIQRVLSSDIPPPGTIIWTCGWWVMAEPQLCSTAVAPMRAPRCLGSAAIVSSVSAAVRNKRS